MKAVFVDGVGRTKELDIPEKSATYRWPIPLERRIAPARHMTRKAATEPPTSEYAVAVFEYLGTLADDRLVYTQREAKLSMWRIEITHAEIKSAKRDIVEYTLNKFLKRHGQPAIVLARTDDRPKDTMILEGVARQMEKP